MNIGTRVLYPEEVDMWDAEILQISVYQGMENNMQFMRKCVDACRNSGMRYVIHPVKYSVLTEETFSDITEMAQLSDHALILHDERSPDGNRLNGTHKARFGEALKKLKSLAHVSFENGTHTGDVQWFWDNYADSITLDIGHIESFGLNAPDFVRSLDTQTIDKVHYVHMHRNNGLRGGITDHWPLTPGCREMEALKELVTRKPDVGVLLELNEVDEIEESLTILTALRNELSV